MDSLNSEITGSNHTFTTSDGKYLSLKTLVMVFFLLSFVCCLDIDRYFCLL